MANNAQYCRSELQIAKNNFIWTIDHFSYRGQKNGEYLESAIFTARDVDGREQEWQAKIYPNGKNEQSADQISIFVVINPNYQPAAQEYSPVHLDWVISPERGLTTCSLKAKLGFAIWNSKRIETMEKELFVNETFSRKVDFGIPLFLKRQILFDNKEKLLPGDKLTIVCKIENLNEMTFGSNDMPKIEVPESQMVEEIGNLFGKMELADCTIVSADNKQFMVHKCILACRSPVFGAMFQHGMTEARNNVVEIPDFESDVLEQLIQFMYNENAVNFANIGEKLLAAADKYQLERLKNLCERELSQSMCVENACQLLILATSHTAEKLKLYAIEYIRKHNQVKETEGWKMLEKEHLDMLGM